LVKDATGESVGKYSKRTILPVHKIDNISVALNFLSKKGVDVHFTNPQGKLPLVSFKNILTCNHTDLMDGSNKGKILTLFNYIVKAFP
jgi:hypothetical protein